MKKGSIMNHQPYEDWLFSDNPILPEHRKELQEHLRKCDSCRQLSEAWGNVQTLLSLPEQVKPNAGFSARWLSRLEERERRNEQRQSWMMLILTGGVAAILLILMGVNILTSVDQPLQLLLIGTQKLIEWVSVLKAINEVISAVIELVTFIIPPVWWVVFAGMISLLCLLWMYSLRQLIQPRRII
jgi:predicted anti-sigma-YlaC factor YlaD